MLTSVTRLHCAKLCEIMRLCAQVEIHIMSTLSYALACACIATDKIQQICDVWDNPLGLWNEPYTVPVRTKYSV